ncbi:HicA toxin of toxin-antitoxin [Allochromatium warmingii]|uniref:HicA toxin of toxin-antitoxin n=1 Tax=Allochromatium warmingii TaxID=61595 RepID=A0A1H3INZ7_ALLWA|nr:type II toxin-antitoxin system HicA family toxin [Allochromatium warmingii]SDY28544.1 HicA toxin of toxin-antitoxin [Allochromatium warmingii]
MLNSTHRKIHQAIFTDPLNGNLEWSRIEVLLLAIGCRVIEGRGSAVTFEKNGIRANFHRPHPHKEALKYRVKNVRDFLIKLGIVP